jgi:hypothetical protein
MTSSYRTLGAFTEPVTVAQVTADKTFTVLDPARDIALDFFAAAINGELGTAWSTVADTAGMTGTTPVTTKWPKPLVTKLLQEEKATFPILALSRVSSRMHRVSIHESKQLTQWSLDYVLGELGSDGVRKMADVVTVVPGICEHGLQDNCHANYLSGAAVFGPGSSTFTEIQIDPDRDIEYGPAKFAGDDENAPTYWSASIPLLTDERTGFVPLSGGAIATEAQWDLDNSNGIAAMRYLFDSKFPGHPPT